VKSDLATLAGFEMGPLSAEIKPYRISIGDDVLDDLESRLRNTRWPGSRAGRRLEPGRAAEMDQGHLPLLG
jgi:hypothetical protein